MKTATQEMNADSTTARPTVISREREEEKVVCRWRKLSRRERVSAGEGSGTHMIFAVTNTINTPFTARYTGLHATVESSGLAGECAIHTPIPVRRHPHVETLMLADR
jgi:hypothetical protein